MPTRLLSRAPGTAIETGTHEGRTAISLRRGTPAGEAVYSSLTGVFPIFIHPPPDSDQPARETARPRPRR